MRQRGADNSRSGVEQGRHRGHAVAAAFEGLTGGLVVTPGMADLDQDAARRKPARDSTVRVSFGRAGYDSDAREPHQPLHNGDVAWMTKSSCAPSLSALM